MLVAVKKAYKMSTLTLLCEHTLCLFNNLTHSFRSLTRMNKRLFAAVATTDLFITMDIFFTILPSFKK